ncbi:hypothetical protein BH11PSE7_BH11PSE7_03800 [soil metagenome]
MSNISVNPARYTAPARRPTIGDAPTGDALSAQEQLGKLQGEHDAAVDVRERVACYLALAKRIFPDAACQLREFLATQSSGMMAIQAGLPPPPEPPMTPSARDLLELHDFVQKLDGQCSNVHSRLARIAPRGAHAVCKTTRARLQAEIQAGSHKLSGLARLMDDACVEMPEAHVELKRYVDGSNGRAHAPGDMSIKATILLNMQMAKAECHAHFDETARRLHDLQAAPANDAYKLESKPAATEAAFPVLPMSRSALARARNSRNQPQGKGPGALTLQSLPDRPVRVTSAEAYAARLGNLQTNHLENLELQSGVEQQFIQLTRDHPDATLAMWTFLEQRSYADIQAIAAETGYLVPGFDDLPARVRSLVELHAQCLAIAADCTHTEDQILELGARSRVLGARQSKLATLHGGGEQGERKARIERNKEDIRKAYLVVTGLGVTNPEVLGELRAHPQATASARAGGAMTLSQQARVALFYDSVRKEKYRENAQLQARVNELDSAARRAAAGGREGGAGVRAA